MGTVTELREEICYAEVGGLFFKKKKDHQKAHSVILRSLFMALYSTYAVNMSQFQSPFCPALHTHRLRDAPNVLPKRVQEGYVVWNRAVEV